MREDFVSRQISVYQTDKKLVELLDKLKLASVENYAHLHACGERDANGFKQISCIGIKMLDYSNGTGQKTVTVEANLTPDTLIYLFEQIRANTPGFSFTEEKIFGIPDQNGTMMVTKLRIVHSDPNIRKLPWGIEVCNGRGVGVKNAKGGTHMKGGSYQEHGKVFVCLSDADMYRLFSRAARFITSWEIAACPALVKRGHSAIQQHIAAAQNRMAP